MVKQYVLVSNEQRKRLLELIYQHSYSISRAAQELKIYYPTAKAINKVYKRERRVLKKTYRTTGLRDEGDDSCDDQPQQHDHLPRAPKANRPDQSNSADISTVNNGHQTAPAKVSNHSPVCDPHQN